MSRFLNKAMYLSRVSRLLIKHKSYTLNKTMSHLATDRPSVMNDAIQKGQVVLCASGEEELLQHKCDGKFDCNDLSDETGCQDLYKGASVYIILIIVYTVNLLLQSNVLCKLKLQCTRNNFKILIVH